MEISYSTFEMCIVNDYCFQCQAIGSLKQIPFNQDFLMKSCSICDTTYSLYLKHDFIQNPTINISDGFTLPSDEILNQIKSKFN